MPETRQQYLLISDENREKVTRVIKKLIFLRRARLLQNILGGVHPSNLASIWDYFTEPEQDIIISLLDPESAAELISELDESDRTEIFRSKNTEWIIDRLSELDPDDIADILRGLSTREANFIIRRFDRDYSEKIKSLLQYPAETAGAIMTSDFLAVNENARVESIIKQFRKVVEEDELEDIHFIYVVDQKNHYLGYIPLRVLILEKPRRRAVDIMTRPQVTVTDSLDQEQVAAIFRDFDMISSAVINDEGILLGRITIDDIVDVLNEEATEDVFRMVGVNKGERPSNSIRVSFKHRLPWMFINMITTGISSVVVGFFSGVLEQFVTLAVFMPMIAALGGATGNQMVAIVVRGMALGEMHLNHVKWLLFRELVAVAGGAVIIGVLIGIAAAYVGDTWLLGAVVSSALIMNMLFATITGAGIPMLLRLLRLDPALGSSILVSAVTDTVGFLIFLGLATKVLLL